MKRATLLSRSRARSFTAVTRRVEYRLRSALRRTWGATSFANDDAVDWVAALIAGASVDLVRDTLASVADAPADEYLEAPEAQEAIAVVVAAAGGRPAQAADESALTWAHEHREAMDLSPLARAALDRVLARNSELPELWRSGEAGGRTARPVRKYLVRSRFKRHR